jgi:hypothetical protein
MVLVDDEYVSIELNSVSIERKHDSSICLIINGNNSKKFDDVTSHMISLSRKKRQQQMRD